MARTSAGRCAKLVLTHENVLLARKEVHIEVHLLLFFAKAVVRVSPWIRLVTDCRPEYILWRPPCFLTRLLIDPATEQSAPRQTRGLGSTLKPPLCSPGARWCPEPSTISIFGRGRTLAGLEAQLLVNGVAAKAEEALAALKVSLQMLSGNERSSQIVEVFDLHRQAAEVVSTCNGWLKLADAMAQLLNLECAHLEKLLTQHAHCEQLTAETLLNARQGSRVKS